MRRSKRHRRGQILVEHLVLIVIMVLPIAALVPVIFRIIQMTFYRISAMAALPLF